MSTAGVNGATNTEPEPDLDQTVGFMMRGVLLRKEVV